MCFDTVEFGKRLRELREERGMTQEELAQKVNVEKQHIYRIEKGKRACSIDVLFQISEVLNCSTNYLLKGNNIENERTKRRVILIIEL